MKSPSPLNNDADYYRLAGESSSHVDNHEGLIKLRELSHKSEKILDLGCGEGTRLNTLLKRKQKGTGIDINKFAISQAQKKYSRHNFKTYDGKKIPFKDDNFDLVYTAFVLEHTTKPEKIIDEMIRVLKPQGKLVILCPNFGAPNRRSPNSKENPLKKLLSGLLKDFLPPKPNHLHWQQVAPKKTYDQPDDDTTIEPYLHTLLHYLRRRHLKIDTISSLWSQELSTNNPRKLLFMFLGQLNLFPFKLWGPQVFISATKLQAI